MAMNYKMTEDMIRCQLCSEAGGADPNIYHLPPECKPLPPPTLSCSEVVERLAAEVADELLDKWPTFLLTDEQVKKHIAEIVRTHSTAILHSWRERRVQELENLIAKHSLTPEIPSTQLDTTKEKK